jgi:hypothetical protein
MAKHYQRVHRKITHIPERYFSCFAGPYQNGYQCLGQILGGPLGSDSYPQPDVEPALKRKLKASKVAGTNLVMGCHRWGSTMF